MNRQTSTVHVHTDTGTHTHSTQVHAVCERYAFTSAVWFPFLTKKTSTRSSIAYCTTVTSCNKPFLCIAVQNAIKVQHNYNTANFKVSVTHTDKTSYHSPETVTPLKTVGDKLYFCGGTLTTNRRPLAVSVICPLRAVG